MSYRIGFTRRAERELEEIDRDNRAAGLQVVATIAALANNPRPAGAKKLATEGDLYRVRSGDYRINYKVEAAAILVFVIKVGDRKEIYRYLKKLK